MLRNPFGESNNRPADAAQSAEREVERKFIERLDRRLSEMDPKHVLLLDSTVRRRIPTPLRRAYVYHEALVHGRTYIGTPVTRQEINGIRLQFTADTETHFGEAAYLNIATLEDKGFYEEYRSLIELIQGVKNRAIPEDKKLKLLEQLDTSRRALHDRAAVSLKDHLFLSPFCVEVEQPEAKKLFEVLYRIWDAPQNLHGLTYSEGALDGVDLKALEEHVLRETGAKIDIDYFTYGFHEGSPRNQYEISFVEPAHPDILPKVKQIIAEYTKIQSTY